ncbi:MAG: hypoxanthine phosphoribosyltransferase [Gaiellales bacterium]|nr:MAG: hypoxanthine phosphoribosyltransferase [Gaiellales bacterium]
MVGKAYLPSAEIAERVRELGAEISRDYEDLEPVLISILKGAVFFLADLAREITVPMSIDFIAISTLFQDQQEGMGSRRQVRFLKDLDQDVEGRHLLIVEDVIDTGLTLNYIIRNLWLRNPASLEIATLLDRPYRRMVELPVKYRGFTVPDEFFVGYGFDYKQKLRNLPDICELNL